MKRFFVMGTAVMVLMIAATAWADNTMPELRGTWRGPTKIQALDKVIEKNCAIVIDVQNGNTFTGYKLYFNGNNVLVKEKFAGLYENGKIFLAENTRESGFGYLTSKQTLVLNYIDHSASPRVQVCHLERLRFTSGFVEIDKDGDKSIIRAEITNYYPLNAERIIKEADKNGDGKLTQKEWDAWKKLNDWFE